MTQVKTDKAPQAIGLYSVKLRTGSLVLTSEQIPIDPASGAIAEAK